MKQEFNKKLVDHFPFLYCRCTYMECNDGWFNLLYNLSLQLECLIRLNIEDNTEKLCLWCTVEQKNHSIKQCHGPKGFELEHPRAVQVKEKFGGLRFYMSTETEEMSKVIAEAEKTAWKTCEFCGDPGILRRGNWIRTLCEGCYET